MQQISCKRFTGAWDAVQRLPLGKCGRGKRAGRERRHWLLIRGVAHVHRDNMHLMAAGGLCCILAADDDVACWSQVTGGGLG